MIISNKNKDHAMIGVQYSNGIVETIYIHENVQPKNLTVFLKEKDFEQMISIIREGDIKEITNSVIYKYIDDPNENPEDCESVRFLDENETIKFFKSSVCRYFYLMKWESEDWVYVDKNQNLEWRKL
jgi:hypothetical protein